MLLNSQSLVNKVGNVLDTLSDHSVDMAGICETWLCSLTNSTTAVIKSRGYSIIHSFRKDKRGGGTALIYKTCYTMSPYDAKIVFNTFEYTAASIKTLFGTKVMYVIIYRTGNLTSIFNKELDHFLSVTQPLCDCMILAGDLNVHFEHDQIPINKHILDLLQSYGLERKVFDATHISGGSLDQIFIFSMHNKLKCNNIVVDTSRSVASDHFPVYCDLTMEFEKKYFKHITYRRVSNIDQTIFSFELSNIVNKIDVSSSLSFEKVITQFNQSCQDLVDLHAPLVSRKISTVESAPWFDKEYRELRKIRRKAENKMKKPDSQLDDKIAYKDACAKCTAVANIKKKEYFTNIILQSSCNTKKLYQVVNKVLDRKQNVSLPDYTDDITKLADDFNSFFTEKIDKIRKSITPKRQTPQQDDFPTMGLMFDFHPTNLDEIKSIINEVGFKCSPSDLLPHKLYKENLDIVLPVIVELVNLSLSTGNIDGIKLADIIPSLKNESLDPNQLKNFRPISNLTFIGKITERVVLNQLNDHMTRNNLHCDEQSAYKKNHSTETLLIRIWNDLLVASDEKSATILMMLDLSAAFDTVDHDLLLKILKNEIGLRGRVLSWLTSFLKGRTQCIRIGNITSDGVVIKFGVPQGSVLGPVLFNIYIRSIYNYVRQYTWFSILGYADDHQIMKQFKLASQGMVLTYELENCFSLIKSWMCQYHLQMNDSKTEIIVFGPSRLLQGLCINGVNVCGNTSIRFVKSVKNLGVYLDAALTMNKQIIELRKKCFYTLRNINKIRFLLTIEQRKTIVNSLVVSCIDYCNGLYYGISEKLMQQLQLLQNACAKTVMGKFKYSRVGDDLQTLHWLNIRKRVVFKIGLLAFKAVNGIAPKYLCDLFQYCHHGHSLKLIVPNKNCVKSGGQRSFGVIGPRLLNCLPDKVKMCDSVQSFKVTLKTFLFNMTNNELDNLLS